MALTEHSTQHPIVALGRADLVGTMTRCRISAGNLGSIPAIDLPSFHSEHWISSFWPRGARPGKVVIEFLHDTKALAKEADAIFDRHLARVAKEKTQQRHGDKP